MSEFFPMNLLFAADERKAISILGAADDDRRGLGRFRLYHQPADLVIAPDGKPYLYRWHLIPHSPDGNLYFHIQVAEDPERPLHDHPWDNQSVILSGGYHEFQVRHAYRVKRASEIVARHQGDVIQRKAHWGHRLIMGTRQPYTMTIFSTGPKVRDWGFWYPGRWVSHTEVCQLDGNKSVHIKEKME